METKNTTTGTGEQTPKPVHRSSSCSGGRVVSGVFIVAIGVLLLARQAGVDIPGWVFSFEAILIALGLYLGIRHSFRGFGWAIPVLIGGFLLIDDFYPYYDIAQFTWPLIIIGIGLLIIFRPGKKKHARWQDNPAYGEHFTEDYLDSAVVFGGVKRHVISKNFRGGESVTVFGGTELNLSQADINGTVSLELTQVFGGTKLIVPANWKVVSKDLVAILGGIDDKRPPLSRESMEENNKTLILNGTCVFGGIEIKSF